MTLCDRLIGGAVDGLMIAIDTITSFWQTPREVEWAKAAADGLAEREAEEEVWSPPGGNMQTVVLSTVTEPRFGRCTCPCINCSNQAHWMCHGEGVEIDTQQRPDDDDDTPRCYFCGKPTDNIVGTDYDTGEYVCEGCADPETSAPTPGAVDGPAEGEPPEPSAGVGPNSPKWIRDLIEATENYVGAPPRSLSSPLESVEPAAAVVDVEAGGVFCYAEDDLARSAAVESPASVPAAESPAPEFDWVTTAIPVIAGVLAEHVPSPQCNYILCLNVRRETCGEFDNWADWRAHVAPHIAVDIQSDCLTTTYDFPSGDRPRPLADKRGES